MEHPILFNGEMVRAILDGRKTQTRRPVKNVLGYKEFWINNKGVVGIQEILDLGHGNSEFIIHHCPYGEVGDHLWVREGLRRFRRLDFLEEKQYGNMFKYADEDTIKKENQKWTTQYIATSTAVPYAPGAKEGWCGVALWQWKNSTIPPMHMPRWASRITLEITNIRIEKLQYISIDDIEKDGFYKFSGNPNDEGTYIHQFVNSWDSIYAKKGFSWDSNPWIWIIEFKKV